MASALNTQDVSLRHRFKGYLVVPATPPAPSPSLPIKIKKNKKTRAMKGKKVDYGNDRAVETGGILFFD